MSYIIDSDILIYFLKQRAIVVERFEEHDMSELATTRINATELLYGAHRSINPNLSLDIHRNFLNEFVIFEYSEAASEIYAGEKAWLKQKGQFIDDMDLLIASICLAEDKVLVTNNTKHFRRIRGLNTENWSKKYSD